MRLLECNIIGFGAFSDYRLTFNDGLNVILQPNGWGKTTLAAFIKAMFYGFERKRIKDVSENERLRYKPWRGNKYGGTLDFEFDGKQYRITRAFGKTANGDAVKLRDLDSGKKVDIPENGLGEWVFDLDATAFQKSIFINQNGFGLDGSNVGLRNRLSTLVSNVENDVDASGALELLDEARKHYKKTGNRGYISELSASQLELLRQIKSQELQIDSLSHWSNEASQLDDALHDVEEQITVIQKDMRRAEDSEKEIESLCKVRSQLEAHLTEAREKLDRADSGRIGSLTDEELEQIRRDVVAIRSLREEHGAQLAEQKEIASKIEELKGPSGHEVPTKERIDAINQTVTEYLHQAELVERMKEEHVRSVKQANALLADNDELLARVDHLIDGWQEVEEVRHRVAEIESRLVEDRASWQVSKDAVQSAKDQYLKVRDAHSEDVALKAQMVRAEADEIKKAAEEYANLDAVVNKTSFEIAAEEAELKALASVDTDANQVAQEVNSDIAEYSTAVQALVSAKNALEASAESVSLCQEEVNEANRALGSAKMKLLDAQNERAKAASEEASARAEASKAQPARRANPVSIVTVILGIVALITGFATGAVSPVSIASFIVGAVLLVFGLLSLTKRFSKQKEPDQTSSAAVKAKDRVAQIDISIQEMNGEIAALEKALDEKNNNLSKLAEDHEKQKKEVEHTQEVADGCFEKLYKRIAGYFPGVLLNSENIVEHSSEYIERLNEVRPRLISLNNKKKALRESEARMTAIAKEAGIHLNAGEKFSASVLIEAYEKCLADADDMDRQLHGLQSAKAQYDDAVARALGKSPEDLDEGDYERISSDYSPAEVDLRHELKPDKMRVEVYSKDLVAILEQLGVEPMGDSAANIKQLMQIADDYHEAKQQDSDALKLVEDAQNKLEHSKSQIEFALKEIGIAGTAFPPEDELSLLAQKAQRADKLRWELDRARKVAEASGVRCDTLVAEIKDRLDAYGYKDAEDVFGVAEDLLSKAMSHRSVAEEARNAEKQLADWDKKNAQLPKRFDEAQDDECQIAEMKSNLSALAAQRDNLLKTRSEHAERRKAQIGELDDYLILLQKANLITKAKQDAASQLSTILNTKERIERARASLDNRYMGGLTSRFDDYVAKLLEDERLKVSVFGDFEVEIASSEGSHDIAGYSTGYRDILDMCFRMALIDIVFEGERPFVVMDDPFVNLDHDKIVRCMMLLALLATETQIIYFTCHPSRGEDGQTDSDVAFTLPPQREIRESPKQKAEREAEERAKAQAELIASYHVAPVSKGRAALSVLDSKRVIGNNLFTVNFTTDSEAGKKDNEFEVHFIDEKGRALSDRHGIEVKDGRVVPEKAQFSLLTDEESGDTFDLIIHENGKDESELVQRISFKSEIAFTSRDFGF